MLLEDYPSATHIRWIEFVLYMIFETKQEVLDWYDRQDRALTDEFIGSIEWSKVRDHPFDERLIPVILYMRDVEP